MYGIVEVKPFVVGIIHRKRTQWRRRGASLAGRGLRGLLSVSGLCNACGRLEQAVLGHTVIHYVTGHNAYYHPLHTLHTPNTETPPRSIRPLSAQFTPTHHSLDEVAELLDEGAALVAVQTLELPEGLPLRVVLVEGDQREDAAIHLRQVVPILKQLHRR